MGVVGGQSIGRITSALGGISGSTQGSFTSGGFSFDEDTIRRIITRYTALGDSYEDSFDNADLMTSIDGPGLDYASESVAEAANKGGTSYKAYLVRQRDECLTQARLFQQAQRVPRHRPSFRRGHQQDRRPSWRREHRGHPVVRRPSAVAVLGAVALAMVLVGCTDNEPGTALPTDTSEPAAPTSDEPSPTTSSGSNGDDPPSNGAPDVENPIDTSEFEQQPCRMLTDEQARQAGLVPPGQPGEGAVAPSCTWRNRESGTRLNLQFDDESRNGLRGAYAANEAEKYELWLELAPIEGFPAVAASGLDLRDRGRCTILVGTSNEVTFQQSTELSEEKRGQADPCEAAAQVAALALQTMKAD